MQPQLTWVDLTATDRDRVRQVLRLFDEQGTVDELGLGGLRDVLSNALFPGTSVLHTRLRYVLFIPWIYREIESWGGGYDVAYEARRLEVELIDALNESDDNAGVIGKYARESVTQMASTAYWAFLVHLGIFAAGRNQGWYHTHFDSLLKKHGDLPRADDPGVVWTREPTWHPRLPAAPDGFPKGADFSLTSEEAQFVLGRFVERCPGSLLAWLAQEASSELATEFWDEPLTWRAPEAITRVAELGRRFSLHVEGAPLLYNLLLAELRFSSEGHEADEERIEQYRWELAEWAALESAEAPFDPAELWQLVAIQGGRLLPPQQRFVERWSGFINMHGADAVVDSDDLRQLIRAREQRLKGPRARTVNRGRLLDWSGRVGVGRMRFRWPNVRQLLIDLHHGLES